MRPFTKLHSTLLVILMTLGILGSAATPSAAATCPPNVQPGTCSPPYYVGDMVSIRPGVPFVWLREYPASYSRVATTVWPSSGPVLEIRKWPPTWDGYQTWYFVSPIGYPQIFGWVEQASLAGDADTITPTPVAPLLANWSVPMTATLKSSLPFAWVRSSPSSYASVKGIFFPGFVFTVTDTAKPAFDGVQWWWPIQISAFGAPLTGWLEQGSIVPEVTITTPAPGPVITTAAAFQVYEAGYMIWTGNDQQIYVLSGTTNGTWTSYPIGTYNTLPDNPVAEPVPVNRVKPIRGFGRIWGNFPAVRQSLGWALKLEVGYTATITIPASSPMAMGVMTQISLPDGRVAKLSSNGQWTF